MVHFSWILSLACAIFYMPAVKPQLPLDFEKCHFDDTACCTNIANIFIKKYAKIGLRAINLPPFDPLCVKSLKINQNPNSSINVALIFKNIQIHGLANTQNVKLSGLTRDVKGPILLEGTLPQVMIRGLYRGSGTVLGLPFKGNGKCEIALKNIRLVVKLNGKLRMKAGDEYLLIDKSSLIISKPDNVHFEFDGLFDGNNALVSAANAFINENWSEIFEELRPPIQQAFALILLGITKNIFNKYSYTDLFLPE